VTSASHVYYGISLSCVSLDSGAMFVTDFVALWFEPTRCIGFRSRRRRCCCGGKIGSPPRDVCLGMRDAIALSMLTRASRFAHVNVNEVQRQQNTWLPAVASKPVQAKVQVWRFLLC
jgi:hypothetical protein